jgi:Xaa-Pro aminopeptidase
VIVLVGGKEAKSILFCREKNDEREVWDGFRYGPEAAADAFGFAEAYPIASLEQKLPELIANRSLLWHSLGHDADWDRRIAAALNAVRADSRSGARAPGEIRDLHRLLDEMRLTKDAHEIDLMRRAADIASAGHAAPCAPADREWPNTNSKPN